MASLVRSARGANQDAPVIQLVIDQNQTINIGDLVQINATTRKGEAAVAASTTLVGIALEPAVTPSGGSKRIAVSLIRGQVIRLAVSQAGTKKTFADTDKYTTAYDLLNKTTVNPDDTTGGMCYVQEYDNTNKTVDVVVADAAVANIG